MGIRCCFPPLRNPRSVTGGKNPVKTEFCNTFLLLFVLIASIFYTFALIPSAHAADSRRYTIVLGSFADPAKAERLAESQQYRELGAVVVGTRAPGYQRRIIAGCFKSQAEALHAKKSLPKSFARGAWVLSSNHGCVKAVELSSSRNKPILKLAADDKVSPSKGFTPKRWRLKGTDIIAYTDGDHPADFFFGRQIVDGVADVCRFVKMAEMQSLKDEDLQYPRDAAAYRGADGCKIAYVYKLI